MKTRIFSALLILTWPLILAAGVDDAAFRGPNEPQAPNAQLEIFTASEDLLATHLADGSYIAMGTAWGDFNNDGFADLYLTGNQAENVLLYNSRGGGFAVPRMAHEVALPDAVSGGAAWADFDNDGWSDLYVLNDGANVLFHNKEGVGFEDVTRKAGVGDEGQGTTAAWGDYDQDGYVDLYVVNYNQADRLYHNNGDGTFTDASHTLNEGTLMGAGFAASFVDYNNDGRPDLYVINDSSGNVLWRNEGFGCGNWCWADVSEEAGVSDAIHSTGVAIGDYDNDGYLDFFLADKTDTLLLLQNQGDGTFTNVAPDMADLQRSVSGGSSWGMTFLDFNNDGWLDLQVATTGNIHDNLTDQTALAAVNMLFNNTGISSVTPDPEFKLVTPTSWTENPQPSVSFALADYDNDGWVDFVTGNWNEGYRLYHHQGIDEGSHWLAVQLTGGGPVNGDAIGARVYLTTSKDRTLMREISSGTTMGTGNDTTLHFGLGSATVKEARIVWPNGATNTFTDVPIDQVWHLAYPSGDLNITESRGWTIAIIVIVVAVALGLPVWRRIFTTKGVFGDATVQNEVQA